ncbi:MAG: endonuclease III domain-containing protein [Candidatus Promineifilaceae bacterium]
MTPAEQEALRHKVQVVSRLLEEAYGRPEPGPRLDPISELVNTFLSQNTTDVNRDRAFARLRERFPDWEAVMSAPEDEVEATIRPAGLAGQKAPRIQAALRHIYAQEGRLSLDFLADVPLEEAKRWLTELRGVGPKTAAIVLLFALGRPAFPVDTHVHRVSRRLGLIGPNVMADKAHDMLENLVEPDLYYPFHINLIRHGRRVCIARNPKCGICVLSRHCDYYQSLQSSDGSQSGG